MITDDEIKRMITAGLPDAQVEVRDMTGTRDHFDIVVVSNLFRGKPLIDQHKAVLALLEEEMKDRIHAVQIKTRTPK